MRWRSSVTGFVALVAVVTFALVVCSSTPTVAQQKKPNFIMIMTDDVGWGDLGCYGGGGEPWLPNPEPGPNSIRGNALHKLLWAGKLYRWSGFIHYRADTDKDGPLYSVGPR